MFSGWRSKAQLVTRRFFLFAFLQDNSESDEDRSRCNLLAKHARLRSSRAIFAYGAGPAGQEQSYTFFIDSNQNIDTFPREAKAHLVRASAPTTLAASSDGHRSAGDMWRMSREMSRARLDLLLFPTIYSYVPVFSRAKKIVMIHDIIAETYPRLTLPGRTARLFWKAKVALGRWQADAVATVSEYSRQGIIEYFRIPADRVSVVSEASDAVFRLIESPTLTPHLRSLGLREKERFITYVGGFSPHKNLQGLVKAFAANASKEGFSDGSARYGRRVS